MRYIDEKFKENPPGETVDRLKRILGSIGIETVARSFPSGIENCHSVRVSAKTGFPGQNGKGVTEEFALASGYAEFAERLQCGLFYTKFPTFENDPSVCIHSFAPDARMMTKEELIREGDWMDQLILSYGHGLTKEKIASLCELYAGSEKILSLPFYSLFEDKYYYIPTAFISQIYGTNGCCAGNSRNEAWVHALSEMLERNFRRKTLKEGKPLPEIPDSVLSRYGTVSKIISEIRSTEHLDVRVFDCSHGCGIPVIASMLTDKRAHGYILNTGADPVFEIALERTLTEALQGRNIGSFGNECVPVGDGRKDDSAANIFNLLESSRGTYPVSFFTDSEEDFKDDFDDNSTLTNRELLEKMLAFYKNEGKRLFVRNCSFLGFDTYYFISPGFSEALPEKLTESIPGYYFSADAARAMRDLSAADTERLQNLMTDCALSAPYMTRNLSFPRLAGLPLSDINKTYEAAIHYAYAAWKLEDTGKLLHFLDIARKTADLEKEYTEALWQYFTFIRIAGTDSDTALSVIEKFYPNAVVDRLKRGLKENDPFEGMILHCDTRSCENCRMKEHCSYGYIRKMTAAAGEKYRVFTDGQKRENFIP